jgi:hypothetical protein
MPNGELSVYAQPVASANAAAQQRQQTNLLRNQSALVGKQVGSYDRDQNRDDYTAQTSRLSAEASASNAQSRGRELINDERGLKIQALTDAGVGALNAFHSTQGTLEEKTNAANEFLGSEAVPEFVGTGQNATRLRGNVPFNEKQMNALAMTQAEHLMRGRPPESMQPNVYHYVDEEGNTQREILDKNKPQEFQAFVDAHPGGMVYSPESGMSSADDYERMLHEDTVTKRTLLDMETSTLNMFGMLDNVRASMTGMRAYQLGNAGGALRAANSAYSVFKDVIADAGGGIFVDGNNSGEFSTDGAATSVEDLLAPGVWEAKAQAYGFDKLAQMSAQGASAKRELLMLVYMEAQLAEPGGRFSDRDIFQRMDGLDGSSVETIQHVLHSIEANTKLRMISQYRALYGRQPGVSWEERVHPQLVDRLLGTNGTGGGGGGTGGDGTTAGAYVYTEADNALIARIISKDNVTQEELNQWDELEARAARAP